MKFSIKDFFSKCDQIRRKPHFLCSKGYIRNESRGDKNSNLSLDEYFNKIKPYLWDIVIDLQSFNT